MTNPPQPRTGSRGQVAVSFLIVMGFLLLLVRLTINLGQASQVRVEVANAADASALAHASWMASGQNEAAWISRKMWDAIWMTKALHFVPLCPGSLRLAYAQRVWRSLDRSQVSLEPCDGDDRSRTDRLKGCGPNTYFRYIAQGAIDAGAANAPRESATARINNLLLRYPTALGFRCPFPSLDPICLNQFASFQNQLLIAQKDGFDRYFDGGPAVVTGYALRWTNGLAMDDAQFLQHDVEGFTDINRSNAPVFLTQGIANRLTQFLPEETGFPYFQCRFVGFQGMNRDVIPGLRPGPLPLMPDIPLRRPLGINPVTGAKYWDLDLTGPANGAGSPSIIPGIAQMYGICEAACGINPFLSTGDADIAPAVIDAGAGTVEVDVTHTVSTTAVPITPSSWEWPKRFRPISAGSTAAYTSANVAAGGSSITAVPTGRTAKASITGVQ